MLPEVPQAIRNASEPLNRGLLTVDALLQSAVVSHTQTVPPINPVQGQRWIIPQDAIGAWQNRTNHIAYRGPEGWIFLVPRPGWLVWSLEVGTFYVYKSSGWEPLSGGGAGAENPLAVYEHFNDMDFQTPASGTSGVHYLSSTNSGNVAAVNGESGRIGIVRLQKLVASDAQANLYSAPLLVLGDGETTFECDVRLSPAQATSTGENGALLRIGLFDQTIGDPDNGVYFFCFPTVNSAQWVLRTESGGAITTLNSSFAHVANAWFRLRFVVNADASEVEAFVNDVSFGTVTTNIPVGAALRTRFQIWQASGYATGDMYMHVDWVRVRKVLTVPRI